MRPVCRAIVSLALVGVLALSALGEEKEIALSKLPKKVVNTLHKKYSGAKMESATKGTEDGETYYSVILKHKGETLEVSLTPDGEITEVAKEIAVKDLPKEVAEALDSKYPKATIKEVAEVTEVSEKNRLLYHVDLTTADKKDVKVRLDPKGKFFKDDKEEKKQ